MDCHSNSLCSRNFLDLMLNPPVRPSTSSFGQIAEESFSDIKHIPVVVPFSVYANDFDELMECVGIDFNMYDNDTNAVGAKMADSTLDWNEIHNNINAVLVALKNAVGAPSVDEELEPNSGGKKA